ncbi:SET domain-containing protein-lysine N-methyltransferase [soil metagenome]
MLLVDARAGMSKIQGIGLFAHEFIPKGTCVWVFDPDFDVVFTEEKLQSFPPPAQRQARRYAYDDPTKQLYILASDDSRFTNHADDANLVDDCEANFAARDIQVGEEITWDYRPWAALDFLEGEDY